MSRHEHRDAASVRACESFDKVESAAGTLPSTSSAAAQRRTSRHKDGGRPRLFALADLTNLTNVTTAFRDRVSIAEEAQNVKGRHPTLPAETVSASACAQIAAQQPAYSHCPSELARQHSSRRAEAHDRGSGGWLVNFEEVTDIDRPYRGSVQLVPEYAQDNAEHMRHQEVTLKPLATYMTDVQQTITNHVRAVLVDWLVEVADDFKLTTETLYLSVCYMDRFLSRRRIDRDELQLLGITCLMIAAKYEEINPPLIERFAYVTDNTCSVNDIVQVEAEVLQHLEFDISMPTSKAFLQRFLRAAHIATAVEYQHLEQLTRYILELSLLDSAMLSFRPSTVAASVLLLARILLAHPTRVRGPVTPHVVWTRTMEHYAFHSAAELEVCTRKLHKTLLSARTQGNSVTAVSHKYLQARRGQVAGLPFLPELPVHAFDRFASFPVPVSYFEHLR